MKRRAYLLLQSILRELVCLGCIVLLNASKVTAQEADTTAASASKSSDRPEWVGKQPHQEGETYVWPVASGPPNHYYSSAADAETELRKNAVAAVKEFIEVRLIREEEAGQALSQDNGLRKLTLKEILDSDRYVELGGLSGYRTHGVLRFTPAVTREIERQWQQHPSNPENQVPARATSTASRSGSSDVHVSFDSTLAWGPIFFLVVILVAVWLVMNRDARNSFFKFAPASIVILLLVGYWMASSKVSRSRQPAQVRFGSGGFVVATNVPAPSESNTHKEVEKVAAAGLTPEAEGTSPATATALLPSWAHDLPQKRGDDYFVVVRSGQVSDFGMREESLRVKMVAAADRYIDEILYRDGTVSAAAKIDAAYLREHCVASEYRWTEPGSDETFVQLKFNQQFRNEVKARYQRYVSISRVEQLGGITLGVLGVLATALALLRFTKPRDDGIKRAD